MSGRITIISQRIGIVLIKFKLTETEFFIGGKNEKYSIYNMKNEKVSTNYDYVQELDVDIIHRKGILISIKKEEVKKYLHKLLNEKN